jgi:hypothetical protein
VDVVAAGGRQFMVASSPTPSEDDGALPGLSELFNMPVLECVAIMLARDECRPAVLSLLVKIAAFHSGCLAIVSCAPLVEAVSKIVFLDAAVDDISLFHALRLHVSLCAVPAARAVVEPRDTWVATLLTDASVRGGSYPVDVAHEYVDDSEQQRQRLRYRRVVDIMASDAECRRLLLRADVVRDVRSALVRLIGRSGSHLQMHGHEGGAAGGRAALYAVLRNLLAPLCEDQVAAAEVADCDDLMNVLFALLRHSLCVREVVTILSLVSCCPEGCSALCSSDAECLPLLIQLVQAGEGSSSSGSGSNSSSGFGSGGSGSGSGSGAGTGSHAAKDSGITILRLASVLCLARLCGESDGLSALWSAADDFPVLWSSLLDDPSLAIRQRALLGVKYMLLHPEGRRLVLSSLLWLRVVQLVTVLCTAAVASSESEVALLETAIEAVGVACRPYTALNSAALTLTQMDGADMFVTALERVAGSKAIHCTWLPCRCNPRG